MEYDNTVTRKGGGGLPQHTGMGSVPKRTKSDDSGNTVVFTLNIGRNIKHKQLPMDKKIVGLPSGN
jgi:hypothetical protein